MAKCPNRNRKKTAIGGGDPGCRGNVHMVLSVPVAIPIKRIPKGSDGPLELLKKSTLDRGAKIPGDTIKRIVANDQYDVICDTCGWSLRNACKTLKKRK